MLLRTTVRLAIGTTITITIIIIVAVGSIISCCNWNTVVFVIIIAICLWFLEFVEETGPIGSRNGFVSIIVRIAIIVIVIINIYRVAGNLIRFGRSSLISIVVNCVIVYLLLIIVPFLCFSFYWFFVIEIITVFFFFFFIVLGFFIIKVWAVERNETSKMRRIISRCTP